MTVFARDPDNHYVEPSWVSERLFAVERFEGRVVDPCAGFGRIVASARAAGLQAEGYDLRQRDPFVYGYIPGDYDFLVPQGSYMPGTWPADNIVSNPPFGPAPYKGGRRLEEAFIERALARARCKVAVFLPAAFLNGSARGAWLEALPLYRVWFCSPRPSCPPGHVVAAGKEGGSGTTDYAWLTFLKGFSGSPSIHFLRRDG